MTSRMLTWLPGARVRTMRSKVLVLAAMLPSGRPNSISSMSSCGSSIGGLLM